MNNMTNYKTGSQRYNDKMDKIWEKAMQTKNYLSETEQKLNDIQNNLLEIIDNLDAFTRSDLQGAVEAQVYLAYKLGKNLDFEQKLLISKEII